MEKKNLFNEYEAYSNDGRIVAECFELIMKDWLARHSEVFGARDLELLCIDVLTSMMAEIRIRQANQLRRDKLQGTTQRNEHDA
jgi:hypothetical protein